MKYLIGTDIGTSGTKSIVMSADGNLAASASGEYGVITDKPLWAEQWPDVWVEAVKDTIRRAVKKSRVPPEDIAGICVSGLYGGSGIPLDENMKPVRPCLIWMDRRAAGESRQAEQSVGAGRLFETTWNGTDPYYGYTKILWIKNHEPENWKRIRLFLPPNAYAIYCLTGETAIDYSSAGNLGGIFDMKENRWSGELMEKLGIPRTFMPERLAASDEVVGGVLPGIAEELGIPANTPVCAGGVDCTVAALGLGVLHPGQQVAVIGTSMTWGFVHRGEETYPKLITMPYVKDPGKLYFTFGGAATAGALIRWFRDQFAESLKASEESGGPGAYVLLDREAQQIPAGSEGLLVLPFFMGERAPVWNIDAKGTVFGLTLHHTRAHVYRAFLESVAYSLLYSMENGEHRADSGEPANHAPLVLAGGVAKSPLWKQIFADVTGCPVVSPDKDVEANLGDVILAGVGCGLFDYEAAKQWQVMGEPVLPDPVRHEEYERCYRRYQNLYESLKGPMREAAGSGERK